MIHEIRMAATALCWILASACACGAEIGENVAVGKSYSLRSAPNYALCTDPGDKTQLTDGQYTEGYFWTQPGTVGWAGRHPVVITPVFLDETTVTAGKHMEAIREGVEDYETLRMLSDRVEQLSSSGSTSADLAAARKLLATAAERVTAVMDHATKINWREEKDRSVADRVRSEVLDTLVRLSTAD